MRSYEAARGLFSFMALVGWIIVAGGVIAAFVGVSVGSEMGRYGYGRGPGPEVLLFMLPGVGIGIVGVITLALSQMGRAGVDTAEYSQQMLQISRESLDVSRQSLRQGEQLRTSFEALKVNAPKEPSASYAELRAGSPPQTPAAQPTPAPEVGVANRAAEQALGTVAEAPALHAPAREFSYASLNGSPKTTQSS